MACLKRLGTRLARLATRFLACSPLATLFIRNNPLTSRGHRTYKPKPMTHTIPPKQPSKYPQNRTPFRFPSRRVYSTPSQDMTCIAS